MQTKLTEIKDYLRKNESRLPGYLFIEFYHNLTIISNNLNISDINEMIEKIETYTLTNGYEQKDKKYLLKSLKKVKQLKKDEDLQDIKPSEICEL